MTKQALITGTGSGIGLSLATRLLDMGWQVHGLGRSEAKELRGHARYGHTFCDLSDLKSITAVMQLFLASQAHLTRVDAVFLNAGQFGDGIRRVSDTPMKELLFLQRLNSFSAKAVLDPLLAAGIDMPLCVVSASIAGLRARAGNAGYAISKATLNMLMELYALEHPRTFFAIIGLCVADTFLSRKIGALPLPNDTIFAEQAKLRSRAFGDSGSGYIVGPDQRAEQLISLLLPQPNARIASGKFVEIRDLIAAPSPPILLRQ